MARLDADPSLAMALLGVQDASSIAGAAALALVLYTRGPYAPLGERELEHARELAERFNLAEDLAPFIPEEPGMLAGHKRKDAFRSVLLALKRIDELTAEERAGAVEQLRLLLGAGGRQPS